MTTSATKSAVRCERVLNADEQTGWPFRVNERDFHYCDKPATASVEGSFDSDWCACDEHADEAESDGATVERWS